jgi:hypothetical protein
LESDRLHVCLFKDARDVHVQIKESIHDTPQFGLFQLQLREQMNEPFETALLAVDPKEIHL